MIPHAPAPPEWLLDFDALDGAHDWVRRMRGCPQNPAFHAEGDVHVHTRMVVEAMLAMDGWSALPVGERGLMIAAALLHDVAKPDCTRLEDGNWTSRGHARRGEILARRILWELDVPFHERETVASLVAGHQIPFWLLEREQPTRILHAFSQRASCARLALLAEADARGRICDDQGRLLEAVELFAEAARDAACWDGPRMFASDHSRFVYFRNERRDPDHAAHDDTRCEAVLMSGLPGAGKDTWIEANLQGWPVISLDALRARMRVAPTAPQGPIVQAARELARENLRASRSFVWNATNLSREVRKHCIDLFADYGARVRIVYVEAPRERLEQQNEQRPRPVPAEAIEGMLARWEVPDATEAHRIEYCIG